MELHFQDVTVNSATLLLEWEDTRLKILISVDEKERIFKAINRTLVEPSSFDYYQAALYLHETQTDLEKALEYIRKVTTLDSALFFQVTREALILKDLKRNKEAIEIANRALILSKKAGNKDFVRLNKKNIKEVGF